MTIMRLSDTTPEQTRKLLESCGIRIIKQDSGSFSLECPNCRKEVAYIYFNGGTRKIDCNRKTNCGHSVDLWDLLAQRYSIHNIDNMQMLKCINETLGFEFNSSISHKKTAIMEEDPKKEFLSHCDHIFKDKLNEREDGKVGLAWQYLQKRGYSEEQIRQMNLGYFPDKQELTEKLKTGHNFIEVKLINDYFSKIFHELYVIKDKSKQHRLVFTCYNALNEVAGFTVRRIDDEKENGAKYLNSTGYQKSCYLFNFKDFKEKKIVIVEGQFDALAGTFLTSEEIRRQYCFVATGGNTISKEQAKLLRNSTIREVIIFRDNDKAGENYKKSISILLEHEIKARVTCIPKEYKDIKDIDELLRKYPGCALNTMLQSAKKENTETQECFYLKEKKELVIYQLKTGRIKPCLVVELEDLASEEKRQQLERELENKRNTIKTAIKEAGGYQELKKAIDDYQRLNGDDYTGEDFKKYLAATEGGIYTGIEELDRQGIFFQPSSLAFIAGRTGHGKTTILLNMLVQSIINNPEKSYYYCSYEEDEGQILNKIILIASKEKDINIAKQDVPYFYTVKNYLKHKNGITNTQSIYSETIETAYTKVIGWIDTGRLRILKKERSVEDLQNKLIERVTESKNPIGLIFIDYLQMLSTNKNHRRASTRQIELQEVCNVLLDITHQIKTPLVLGAQMNREAKEDEGVAGLTLDKLRECGDIEQHANLVLGIWDETQYKALKATRMLDEDKYKNKLENTQIKSYKEDMAKTEEQERNLTIKVLKNRNGKRGISIKIEIINDLFKIT